MKKKRTILIVILVLICLLVLAWYLINTNIVKKANNITFSNLELSYIDDGIYVGEYTLLPVKVILQVEIKNHQIHEINILEHQNGFGKKAEVITRDIIEKQSLDVDLVSGATVSNKVILKAIDNALNK